MAKIVIKSARIERKRMVILERNFELEWLELKEIRI